MKRKHSFKTNRNGQILLLSLVLLMSALIILPSGCLDGDTNDQETDLDEPYTPDAGPEAIFKPADDVSSDDTNEPVTTEPSVQTIIASTSGSSGSSRSSGSSSSSPVALTGISINQADQTLYAGKTLQLTVTFTPTTASNKVLSWTSNDTNVATVGSSSGLVTGVAGGVANITATSADGGYTDSIIITVTETPTVTSAAELQAAIEANGVTSITLGGDITGDVTATRTGSTNFDIDFGT
ncbi:MAG: hypothetical protein PWP14_2271, partial [Methanolobus sp.]|nr:hypothetical protein [Methanolobus sp.]